MGASKISYKDYNEFIKSVGYGHIEGVSMTHDGYPLSAKEERFIDEFLVTGDVAKSLRVAGMHGPKSIVGKDYLTEEIKYRLELLKKKSIADADEIMQYFTSVMRGQIKDQFGLDAPLCERTSAAKELAKRVIDVTTDIDTKVPEIKITLNWDEV